MTYFTPDTITLLETWAEEIGQQRQGVKIILLPDHDPDMAGKISQIFTPTTTEENVTDLVREKAETEGFDLHFSKEMNELSTINIIAQLVDIFEEKYNP